MTVYDIVGGSFCVASEDGQKVFDQIAPELEQSKTVVLSFRNVERLTSAFLNAAIGQLYGRFPDERIRAGIRLEEIEQQDLMLLKRVVDTAKAYFKDPGRMDAVIESELRSGDAGHRLAN